MKDFINRNSPIFVLGFFTLVVFTIVITVSHFRQQRSPELVPLTADQIEDIDTSNPNEMDIPTGYEVDQKFGIVEITYSLKGFDPKNAKSIQNQLVRWTNKSDTPLKIVQVTKTYPEFKDGITIEPGKTYEFRLYKPKLWSYKDEKTGTMGSIYVVDN